MECRRCTCLVSVVEQYTQTTLSARVTCDDEEYEAGQSFEVKPGSYPLSVKLDNAETVQAYTLDATPEAFSKLEDDQPLIVTLEMRATEALIDLRVEDEGGTLLEDATVTWTARLTTGSSARPSPTKMTHVCHLCQQIRLRLRGTFRVFRVAGQDRRASNWQWDAPARVTCRVVDEAGNVLEDAVAWLTPPEGPEIKGGSVDGRHVQGGRLPEEVPPVGRAVRPRRRIKEGDDFCISFTDADFARSSVRSPSKSRWSPRAASST